MTLTSIVRGEAGGQDGHPNTASADTRLPADLKKHPDRMRRSRPIGWPRPDKPTLPYKQELLYGPIGLCQPYELGDSPIGYVHPDRMIYLRSAGRASGSSGPRPLNMSRTQEPVSSAKPYYIRPSAPWWSHPDRMSLYYVSKGVCGGWVYGSKLPP